VAGLGLVDTRSTADDEAKRQARLRSAAETEGLDRLPDARGSAEALVGLKGKARGPIVEVAEGIIGSADPAAVAWGQRAMAARPDRTVVLRGIGQPAVVVWGERDTVSDLKEAQTMADALGIPVTRIPGVGHLSPLEAPSALADALAPLR
jgi:pimeloyl-ACP methyl ester carboxylesterase